MQHTSSDSTRLYFYAVAILVATIVAVPAAAAVAARADDRLHMVIDIHDPAVKRTFKLMVPVTIGLGLININALIDQLFATHFLDPDTSRRRRSSARSGSTCSRRACSRSRSRRCCSRSSRGMRRARTGTRSSDTVATGLRLICFLLLPASAAAAVLATPIVRLLYQHGHFTPTTRTIVAPCLAAFALGLTFNGTMLMLNRGFFSLQSPWIPSWVALVNLGVNAASTPCSTASGSGASRSRPRS